MKYKEYERQQLAAEKQRQEEKAAKRKEATKGKKFNQYNAPGRQLGPKPEDITKVRPGKERFFERDGKYYAWIATDSPDGAYVDANGVLKSGRIKKAPTGWELSEVIPIFDKQGNITGYDVVKTFDTIRGVKQVVPEFRSKNYELPNSRPGTPQPPSPTAKGKQPSDARGTGPETRRAFAQDTTPPESAIEYVEDIRPEDGPIYPTSDGNLYDRTDNIPKDIPKVERNRQIRAGIEKRFDDQANAFLMEQAERQKIAELREQLFWADDDMKTLQTLGKQVDVKVEKYTAPSQLARAIEKKINSMMNVYGGVPKLTAEQMRNLRRKYDYDALEGRTQAEVNRLNQVWHETHPKAPSDFQIVHRDMPTPEMTRQRRAEFDLQMRAHKMAIEHDEFVNPRISAEQSRRSVSRASGLEDAYEPELEELTNEYADETERRAAQAQRFKDRRSTAELQAELQMEDAAQSEFELRNTQPSKNVEAGRAATKARLEAKGLRPASERMGSGKTPKASKPPSTERVSQMLTDRATREAAEQAATKAGKKSAGEILQAILKGIF